MSEPCTGCGACCAAYRVDFDCRDLDPRFPPALVVELTEHLLRLRGTDHQPPRCAALSGRIGERVRCGIYEWRPGPCRERLHRVAEAVQRRARLPRENAGGEHERAEGASQETGVVHAIVLHHGATLPEAHP